MIVMASFGGFFIAGAAVAEIVALKNAGILEQLDGAISTVAMEICGSMAAARTIKFLGVGMVLGVRKHASDDAALFCHAQPLLHAEFLDPRHIRLHWRVWPSKLGEIAARRKRQLGFQDQGIGPGGVTGAVIVLALARARKAQRGIKGKGGGIIDPHFQEQGLNPQCRRMLRGSRP